MMIHTILVFCGFIVMSHSKRYDVEAEGKKLYGINENFNSLLRGFRRTPEYKTVLQAEVNEMMEHYLEVSDIYFKKYLEIAQMEALKELGLITLTTTAGTENGGLREGHRTFKDMRQKKAYKFKPNRRSVDFEQLKPDLNMTDKQFIHKFVKFSQQLSTAQNNKLKDIAFKAFGHVIHDVIRAMKNDVKVVSTKQPIGSKEVPGSTDNHPEDHGTSTTTTRHDNIL